MRIADYVRLNVLAAIWGASFLFMRIASPAFGAVNTAFFRVLLGFLGLACILLLLRRSFEFNGKLKHLLVLGAVNSGLPFFMYCIAAKLLPAGYSAVLNATSPLMGALIGFAFFHEKLTGRKWVGVVLGIVGIAIITTVGEMHAVGDAIIGVVACIVAAICYGFAGFLTRRWITERGGLDPKLVAYGSQVGATLFLLPLFAWSVTTGPEIDWLQGEIWASVIAVGIVCTSLAYIIYFRLIADIGPLRSLTVTFLVPPFAMLWGFIVLDETISSGFLLGSAIVLAAVWMVVSPGKSDDSSIVSRQSLAGHSKIKPKV